MALAGAESGDHPRLAGRKLPGRRTNGSTCLRPRSRAVDTTGAGDVFAGVLAAGWLARPRGRVAAGMRGGRVVDAGAGCR